LSPLVGFGVAIPLPPTSRPPLLLTRTAPRLITMSRTAPQAMRLYGDFEMAIPKLQKDEFKVGTAFIQPWEFQDGTDLTNFSLRLDVAKAGGGPVVLSKTSAIGTQLNKVPPYRVDAIWTAADTDPDVGGIGPGIWELEMSRTGGGVEDVIGRAIVTFRPRVGE
jgi:hypothetical protein